MLNIFVFVLYPYGPIIDVLDIHNPAHVLLLPGILMRILVVDDEHLIVKVIGRQLQKAGYHPVCLYDPRQAIEVFKHNPDFDLAILDICMPVITGIEMADEIRKIKPILPIILMTDMLENVTVKGASNIKNVLYKPIPRERLLDTVRKSLYL